MKCLITSCKNHDHQGKFVGKVCSPCYHAAKKFQDGNLLSGISKEVFHDLCKNWELVVDACDSEYKKQKYKDGFGCHLDYDEADGPHKDCCLDNKMSCGMIEDGGIKHKEDCEYWRKVE